MRQLAEEGRAARAAQAAPPAPVREVRTAPELCAPYGSQPLVGASFVTMVGGPFGSVGRMWRDDETRTYFDVKSCALYIRRPPPADGAADYIPKPPGSSLCTFNGGPRDGEQMYVPDHSDDVYVGTTGITKYVRTGRFDFEVAP